MGPSKGNEATSIPYIDSVEEALCFGGSTKTDMRSVLLSEEWGAATPRQTKSGWPVS